MLLVKFTIDGICYYTKLNQIIASKFGYKLLFDMEFDGNNVIIKPGGLTLSHKIYENEFKIQAFKEHLVKVAELFKIYESDEWANEVIRFEKLIQNL